MEAQGGEEVQLLLIHKTELDGGEWSASRQGLALAPGKGPPVPIIQKVGWAPEPVWTQEARGKILSTLPGIELGSPGRPARSQTLYWLTQPGSYINNGKKSCNAMQIKLKKLK
jgi:hypothetical protein